jgi:hypothetical protein
MVRTEIGSNGGLTSDANKNKNGSKMAYGKVRQMANSLLRSTQD